MIDRMIRAAQLDVDVYEQAEHSPALTAEALGVVVLVSLCSGVGAGAGLLLGGGLVLGITVLILGMFQSLIAWALWSFATYFIGTRVFGGTATYGELLRTLAYSYSPGTLAVVAFVPVPLVGGLVALVAGLWTLVAGIIAVRQALDFDTARAVATVLVAAIPAVILRLVLRV